MTKPLGIDPTYDSVRDRLLALGIPELCSEAITPESLLIEELGLDSMKFVDLTVELEDAFGLSEFPMQNWVDEQLEAGQPLTVAGLVAKCREILVEANRAEIEAC